MLQNQVDPPRLGISMPCRRVALAGVAKYESSVCQSSARSAVLSVVPSALSVLTMIDTFGHRAAALVAQQLGLRPAERAGKAQHRLRAHGLARDHDQQMLGQ